MGAQVNAEVRKFIEAEDGARKHTFLLFEATSN